jgi:beta-glucanase (GH16 family)
MVRQSIAFASILLLCTASTAQKDVNCDCFETNGSTAAYFSNHRFFDFRNVPLSLTSDPKVLTNASDTSNAGNTSDFFSSTSWTATWAAQNWDNSDTLGTSGSDATILMINSPNNVYIGISSTLCLNRRSQTNAPLTESSIDKNPAYTTYLTLRTVRTGEFQSAAEIDTTSLNYHYVSARYLARVVGDTGGCGGIFTYRCPSSTGSCSSSSTDVEEGDIEILTRGPTDKIQLTNQPSESASGENIPQATINATLANGAEWSAWNEYRYDWLSGLSTWYVNGVIVGSLSFQAPKNPAQLILNMWSDGGSWTGNMSIGASSFLQVQWIELVYNTSGPVTGSKMVRDGLELLEQVEDPPKSPVSDQYGPYGELRRSSPPLHDRGMLASRGGGCRVVCSVDTNVTSTGTPVEVSMAMQKKAWQAALPLIFLSLSFVFCFML